MQLTSMRQIIPLSTKIGNRSIFLSHVKLATVASVTQPDAIKSEKPDGWNAAKTYLSIPGPKALPVIGNTWRFLPFIGDLHGRDTFELNKLFYKRYGKIARLGGLSFGDTVMIYDVNDIEYLFRNEGIYPIRDVISKSFAYYRKNIRSEVFQDYPGVAEVHGKAWHNVRSKVNPIVMHPQTVLQYVGSMDKIANQLVQKMRHLAGVHPLGEMPQDFNKCLYAWALESIMTVCLDKQLGCLDINLSKDSEPTKIIESVNEMFKLFFKIERSPTFMDIYKTKTWERFVEILDFLTFTFLRHIDESKAKIEKNKNHPNKDTTILEQLLKVDEKLVISTAIDFLNAGVDTTGRVISAGLYYLAKTPKAQKTLREELTKLLPTKDTPITKEVLSDAPYLRAVIKETTRLAPIGSGNIRQTIKDMVLCGYQIPKGTNVVTANLVLSHSEENYIQAKEFIPERWLRTTAGNLSVKSTNPFVSLPFGFGPRSCLGKRIATLELEIGIAKVIRNFYLEWHHKEANFTTNPFYGIVDPLKLRIKEVEQ